jgi:hypothetical protein
MPALRLAYKSCRLTSPWAPSLFSQFIDPLFQGQPIDDLFGVETWNIRSNIETAFRYWGAADPLGERIRSQKKFATSLASAGTDFLLDSGTYKRAQNGVGNEIESLLNAGLE